MNDDEDVEKDKRLQNAEEQRSKTNTDDSEDSFYWKSQSQHIMYFIIYILDWSSLGVLKYEDGVRQVEYDPTLLHYFVVLVACGAPLIFLHTFIGQYAQTGFFAFGTMLPLAYGTGFLMVMFSFVKLSIHVYYACFLLYYLFLSLYNSVVPWVTCYKYVPYPIPCFSWKDFDLCATMDTDDEPCFEPGTKVLAAIYFMKYIGLNGGKPSSLLKIHPMRTHVAVLHGILHGVLVFALLITLSTRSFKNLDATIRISFYLSIVGTASLMMAGFTQSGAINGVEAMKSSIHLKSLLSVQTWSAAFRRLIDAMKFAEGGVIMFGTFMPPVDRSPYRSSILSAAFAFTALFFTIYVNIFEGLLTSKLHLTMRQLMMKSEECLVFALYPVILGIQAYGHLFCFVYFFLIILMNFCSMVLKVIVIEKGLSFQFNIPSHYLYTRFFIGLACFVLTFSVLVPMSADMYYNFLGRLKNFMISLVFLQMVVVHLYGLQRFCDDIQFYHRTQVGTFIKMCWILMPLYCIVEFNLMKVETYEESRDTAISAVMVSGFFIPLLIGLLYAAVVLARDKNLIGLVRPMDKFGPRDIRLRIFRLLYNPRLSEKYMISSAECGHDCLVHSEALEMAIEEETTLIKRLIEELETNKENLDLEESEIVSRLQNHLKIYKMRM